MKRRRLLLPLLFLPALVHAEYEELAALREHSLRVLAEHGKRLAGVDAKFAGVVNFGKALQGIEKADDIDVAELTGESKDYWRALLEMAPTDPSILFAHAHLHFARGEIPYGETYLLLGSLAMDDEFKETLAAYQKLKQALDQRVAGDMKKGIELHDKQEYEAALKAYDAVIAEYPNSAWAFYEKGFSYLMMGVTDPVLEKKRVKMYAECRQRDPYYLQAYQGKERKVLGQLMILAEKVHPFVRSKQRDVESLKTYAQGCEEMELFSFAAHARWRLVQFDPGNMEAHIKKFLDLLPKCGCQEADFFRQQFKFEEDEPAAPGEPE